MMNTNSQDVINFGRVWHWTVRRFFKAAAAAFTGVLLPISVPTLGAESGPPQLLQIVGIHIDTGGQVTIDYNSDQNGRFTLFYGQTVTNITNVLASDSGREGAAAFRVSRELDAASGFYRIAREDQAISVVALGINVPQGLVASNIAVACFIDARGSKPIDNYRAAISWGDGTAPTDGTIRQAGEIFRVIGNHFYPMPGRFLVEVSIRDAIGNSAAVKKNVLIGSGSERFAAQVYLDLMHGQIDSGKLSQWSILLNQGVSRDQILKQILESSEYRKTVMRDLYQLYLRRDPTPAEVGSSTFGLTNTVTQVRASLIGSPEYYQQRGGGSNLGFIRSLYHDVLGRIVQQDEADRWTKSLEENQSRETVATLLLAGVESQLNLVQSFYQQYLRRLADTKTLGALADMVRGSEADLLLNILTSDEYLDRDLLDQLLHPWGTALVDSDLLDQLRNPYETGFIDRQKLWTLLFPILETDYTNPHYDTSGVNWACDVVGGKTFLANIEPPWEWMPILEPRASQPEPRIVGLSGTAINPHRSNADVPFTHPLGKDWVFHIAPDYPYLALLAPSNRDLSGFLPQFTPEEEIEEALEHARAPESEGGLALSVPGVLGVEIDQGAIPEDFRNRDGDRVAVFGRWIIDAGHDDFHAEVHPPLMLVSGRSYSHFNHGPDPDVTGVTVISRPLLIDQDFNLDLPAPTERGLRSRLVRELHAVGESWFSHEKGVLDLTTVGLPPVTGFQTLSFIVRPAAPRRSLSDKLRVSHGFTVRRGVTVYVMPHDSENNAVSVVVTMDNSVSRTFYSRTPRVVKLDEILANLGAEDGKMLQDSLKDAIEQGRKEGEATLPGLGIGDKVAGWMQTVIYQNGVVMDMFNLPPVPPEANHGVAIAVNDLPNGQSPVTVEDNQPFPIIGWMEVWWDRP
jgi:hypothetical protein